MPGFSPDTLNFLRELADNNDRPWFEANKRRYEADVRGPALELVRAMSPHLARIAPRFVASDKKSGGSLMRVYRDTRFSKDKTPYKTNIGIHFRHERAKDVHAPGFYLHVALDGCFVGVGLWKPESSALTAIREKIDAEQARWRGLVGDAFTQRFERGGESLKRPPRGYDKDHPLLGDLKLKSHTASVQLAVEDALRDDLPGLVADHFAAASDFQRFLCEAVGAEWA